jgi:hypothetical protein
MRSAVVAARRPNRARRVRLIPRNGQPPLSAPLLCWPCIKGDHSKGHGAIGCTEFALLATAPHDFVCRCETRVGPVILPELPEIDEEDANA